MQAKLLNGKLQSWYSVLNASDLWKKTYETANNLRKYNYQNLILLCMVTMLGLVFMASASVHEANHAYGNALGYLARQFIVLLISCVLFVFVYNLPLQLWYKMRWWLLMASIILIALPILQNNSIQGAYRWLDIFGIIRFQTIELSRPMFLAFVCSCCYNMALKQHKSHKKLISLMVILTLYTGILWLQPAYSMSLIVIGITLALLFLSGLSLQKFSALCISAILLAIMVLGTASYRDNRISAFLHPEKYTTTFSYQPNMSWQAISSGGFLGNGLGSSKYKINSLPDAHNDFILAIMIEEVGLLMTAGFIALLICLLVRLYAFARSYIKTDMFAGLFGLSLLLVLLINSALNIGFISSLLPVTGLPFPLLSYGGSFMLYSFFSLAIAFRIEYEYKTKNEI